jgi:predicted nucleotidyltransferase
LAALRLRDRDAIITKEGLIFRVFGYSHPPDAYVCDVEYVPSEIFESSNPKAFRSRGQKVFYKFYEDEGLKFVENNYPQYLIFHRMLNRRVAGVRNSDIFEVEKPEQKLRKLMKIEPKDELNVALQNVIKLTTKRSNLSTENFGVFGSILHDFYHPSFSDLDLIVYGRENAVRLRETLQELYEDERSLLKNEFESDKPVRGKRWRFQNYSSKEYVWHQRRKMIYSLFSDEKSGRIIKTEFEPVKEWKEINNEYDPETRISQKGWIKMFARLTEDSDALFIPSIYEIEPLDVLTGTEGANDVRRIVSYMEEFRMQARKDEKIYVEGNLEEVLAPQGSFYQITLTYCPRYYEQVLKVVSWTVTPAS